MTVCKNLNTDAMAHNVNRLGFARRVILLIVPFLWLSTDAIGQLTADFYASGVIVCSGSSVTFTDNSSGTTDTTTYLWDFGNMASPATATGKGPHTVIYTGSGKSTVSLTLTDIAIVTKRETDYITVNALPPTPAVTVSDDCDGTSTLTTTASGSLLWSTMATSSAIRVLEPGLYTVTTTVDGCTSLPGSGVASPRTSPPPPEVSVDCSQGADEAVVTILNPLGEGYTYRLNGGSYQSSPSFDEVSNGSHTVTVRNASGCTTIGSYFQISCECTNPATVTLSSTSGTTCGITPVTVSGNTFGGRATRVMITENGSGSLDPSIAFSSPFTFTYTPRPGDVGKVVRITLTTNDPSGDECEAATAIYNLTVIAVPAAPTFGSIIQPTCSEQTASAEVRGLPATGTWTLTQSPGGVVSTGNGTSITITNLLPGTYTYTVTSEQGCVSNASNNLVIAEQPPTPGPPGIGIISHPTCTLPTGSVELTGLPATGTWTLTRSPGAITVTGSGASRVITGLQTGSYTFTVTNSAGCTSLASSNVVIESQPDNPATPNVGTIVQPTCTTATGSVELSGLPESGTWTLTRSPGAVIVTGSGTSRVISDLPAGTYTYTVSNSEGCTSLASASVVIDPQPATPARPTVGPIVQPTCTTPTGSVELRGLPATGTWTLTGNPGAVIVTGTGTSKVVSELLAGTYTFTVTNSAGCTSIESSNVVIIQQPDSPSTPIVGTIVQPTCTLATGSVELTGLPATGTWTLTRNPGAVKVNGSGTSRVIAGLQAGTYTYTVTNSAGCTSLESASVVIDVQPLTPAKPTVGPIVQPTCTTSTGSVQLTGLPTGTWTLTRSPGTVIVTGSETTKVISELPTGTYTFTVTNSAGCTSLASNGVVIVAQPETPAAPILGIIVAPTCTMPTGSVELTGLPATGTWTLTRSPGAVKITGSGTTAVIAGLPAGTYTFTVTNSPGCTSPASSNVVIIPQPDSPTTPVVGTIVQPTCTLATGSIELTGLPASGTWTLTRYPGTVKVTGSGASREISGLTAGSYTFTVTNLAGCVSLSSASVVINIQPQTPATPIVGTVVQPSCTTPTGSVELRGLPAGTYTLTRSPDGVIVTGSGATRIISGLSTGTYTFTVTNSVGCNSAPSASVAIPLQPGMPQLIITNPAILCAPAVFNLTVNSITAGSTAGLTLTYWNNANATIPYLTPASATEGTYYIKGTTSAGCIDIKPVTAKAIMRPIAYAGPDQVIEYEFAAKLDALPAIDVETGRWSIISGTGQFADFTNAKTLVTGLSSGTNVFLWTITTVVCPDSYDTVNVQVIDLEISTLLTPNMDGRNDYFILRGLPTLGRTELTIFNRLGVKVYENRDYDNLWNGVDSNGNPLPEDTYFFVLRSENGRIERGYFVIRR